jgi:hypothetical protein
MEGQIVNRPNLIGKNIRRRREGDHWFYRFQVGWREYSGSCGTTDKREAEALAARLKEETQQAVHSSPTPVEAVRMALTKGEAFVLLTASGNCISNIDRRDIAALLREQLARLAKA